MNSHTDNTLPAFSFAVENFGCIEKGSFMTKPLTVFCGSNNSGKTWAMYALYFFLEYSGAIARSKKIDLQDLPSQNHVHHHERLAKTNLSQLNKDVCAGLGNFFNADDDIFSNATFECDSDADLWNKWIANISSNTNLLIPAERNGLHLFYRELSSQRTTLLHHASKKQIDVLTLLKDVTKSLYAQPIADYIDWLNTMSSQKKRSESTFAEEATLLQKQLVHGKYTLNKNTGEVHYQPYQKKRKQPTAKLALHTSSSVVKSLFGLWFYLSYQAQKGDTLFIDEPEINVHPNNQRIITHVLARLVNKGINVIISTHSDYIVRELNFLVCSAHTNDRQKTINILNEGKPMVHATKLMHWSHQKRCLFTPSIIRRYDRSSTTITMDLPSTPLMKLLLIRTESQTVCTVP